MNTIDVTKLTELELKAMKSDCYETIAQNQQNLQIINNELNERNKLPTEGQAPKGDK